MPAYLSNLGQDASLNICRIQSDETLRFLYINEDRKTDVLRCIIPADEFNLAAIAGDGIMDTTMVRLSSVNTVFHNFVAFLSKEKVAMGGFRTIGDVDIDMLQKPDGTLVSLADIGLDGDEDNPKLVILPMAFPSLMDILFQSAIRLMRISHRPTWSILQRFLLG